MNHRQAKSDKEVDLINPMVLMLTCLIIHRAYQVEYRFVPVIQPSDVQWQTLRKDNSGSAGDRKGTSTHVKISSHGNEES